MVTAAEEAVHQHLGVTRGVGPDEFIAVRYPRRPPIGAFPAICAALASGRRVVIVSPTMEAAEATMEAARKGLCELLADRTGPTDG